MPCVVLTQGFSLDLAYWAEPAFFYALIVQKMSTAQNHEGGAEQWRKPEAG
jgi:hypothetical protein